MFHCCNQSLLTFNSSILDYFYTGVEILQSHYSVLVRSMPDDYMNTVSQLEHYLSGDHVGTILESKDPATANQRILDCLIELINTEESLLDFCDRLNSITNTPALSAVIEDIKKGRHAYDKHCTYVCTYLMI